jgi:hypothetical protein
MESTRKSSSAKGSRSGVQSDLAQQVKERGRTKVQAGKQSVAEQIEKIADAIDVAGAQFDHDQPRIAAYATRLANGVGGLANRLRNGSEGQSRRRRTMKADDATHAERDRRSELGGNVASTVGDHHLALGALALAVGAVLGVAIPLTDTEKRMMGSVGIEH